MTRQLDTVLQKEVSRQEFLGMSALALASIFGFGHVIKLLTGHSLSGKLDQHTSRGYGSSAYGQ